ncbi:MAG: hypothetical protein ACREBE_28105, partial [bacterium]
EGARSVGRSGAQSNRTLHEKGWRGLATESTAIRTTDREAFSAAATTAEDSKARRHRAEWHAVSLGCHHERSLVMT